MGAIKCAVFSPGNVGQYNAANDTKIKMSRCARKPEVRPFTFTLTEARDPLYFTLTAPSLYHQASKKTTLPFRNMTLKGKR